MHWCETHTHAHTHTHMCCCRFLLRRIIFDEAKRTRNRCCTLPDDGGFWDRYCTCTTYVLCCVYFIERVVCVYEAVVHTRVKFGFYYTCIKHNPILLPIIRYPVSVWYCTAVAATSHLHSHGLNEWKKNNMRKREEKKWQIMHTKRNKKPQTSLSTWHLQQRGMHKMI